MDERRRQNVAYEYLCHLEEAKRWMEACLGEDLPPTTELEEGLRNGVYLAKLGNFFSPKVVSLKKIYDREQTRYKATGLHFRHTDNVIQWLNAMHEIGLPKVTYVRFRVLAYMRLCWRIVVILPIKLFLIEPLMIFSFFLSFKY